MGFKFLRTYHDFFEQSSGLGRTIKDLKIFSLTIKNITFKTAKNTFLKISKLLTESIRKYSSRILKNKSINASDENFWHGDIF